MINSKNVRDVALVLAGYYAAQCEADGGVFSNFGADSITHCNEYIELVDKLRDPPTINGLIDTEYFRNEIYCTIFNKYGVG